MSISLLIYKQIRDNKINIIKNYYYYKSLEEQEKDYYKLNNDDITLINKKSNDNKKGRNDELYKYIILAFNSLENVVFQALICYTTGKPEYFDRFQEIYKKYNKILGKIKVNHINEKFNEFLSYIAENDTLVCDSLGRNRIQISKNNLKDKIENRNVRYGKYKNKTMYPNDSSRHNWMYIIYDDVIYNLIYQDQKMYLCKNKNVNSESEYKFFIEFIENEYSPLKNAMNDPKNNPGPSFTPEEIFRRKSMSNIKDIGRNSKLTQFGKYNSESYFDSEHPNEKHLEFTIKETMACFRNDRDKNGKVIMGAAKSNYRREPFLKQVLNFPPLCTQGKDGEIINDIDLKLVKKIKSRLNKVLQKIKEKYPPPPSKEYFLIDLEGGAGKHFDYSLYAFTEEELNKPQDFFLVKANLWKKLEFKSNKTARRIFDLSNYLSKSSLTLFDTVNSTFGKVLNEKLQDISKNKEWLRENINSDYFANAIENILQGQKDKIYIIWNVEDEKIYLDEFKEEELIIQRDKNGPKLRLDEKLLEKNELRILVTTLKDKLIKHSKDFRNKNYTGDNRWRRYQLDDIAEKLGLSVENENKKVFNRINDFLVTQENLIDKMYKNIYNKIKDKLKNIYDVIYDQAPDVNNRQDFVNKDYKAETSGRWRKNQLLKIAQSVNLSTEGTNKEIFDRINEMLKIKSRKNLDNLEIIEIANKLQIENDLFKLNKKLKDIYAIINYRIVRRYEEDIDDEIKHWIKYFPSGKKDENSKEDEEEDIEEELIIDGKKIKTGSFRFNLKRNVAENFDYTEETDITDILGNMSINQGPPEEDMDEL